MTLDRISSPDRRAEGVSSPHPLRRLPAGHLHLAAASPAAGRPTGRGLYCGPDRWVAIAHEPTTFDGWLARLGGGVGARLSIQGCINGGELLREGDLLTLTAAGRQMIASAAERRPMAVSNTGDGQ